MTKLHQIIPLEKSIRTQAEKDLTEAHHGLMKEALLTGQYREYQKLAEDGMNLPPERVALQVRAREAIERTFAVMARKFDITATRDWANMHAKADLAIDGVTLIKDAPATYLLWLENQLENLHTFVTKLPSLPADTEWVWDNDQNCYRNKHEIKTAKTEKVQEPIVLYPATKEHPAQTQLAVRDKVVGYWTTHKYSGALPVPMIQAMKARVEALQRAVKLAREKANGVEVEDQKVGEQILSYIFAETVLAKK